MARVYISSTYSDLKEHREAVYRALKKMGHDAVAMEDYAAADQRPLDKCLGDVDACDVYVGLFAWRYGYIPPGESRSITELELRQAKRGDKHVLLFMLDEGAPWPRPLMDRDSARIEELRAELQRDYLVSFFTSPDDLATDVAVAVSRVQETTPEPLAVTLRVYNFENHGSGAEDAKIGQRFPGILLNQLLQLQLQAESGGTGLMPTQVWQFRDGPPRGALESFRKLAPCIIVSGFVEDAGAADRYHASIRVSFLDNNVNTRPLLVEEVDFSDDRESMVSALGDLSTRIWREAKRVSDRIEALIEKLANGSADERRQAATELVELGPTRELGAQLRKERSNEGIERVLEVLERLEDPAVADELAHLLDHGDPEIRSRAALAIGRLRPPTSPD